MSAEIIEEISECMLKSMEDRKEVCERRSC